MILVRLLFFSLAVVALAPVVSFPQDDFENPPVSYYVNESQDPVAILSRKIASGEVQLQKDSSGTYLLSLLEALDVPVASQCLVFSKTSLQIHHIGPRSPRAIYFNESVYVGFVQGSNVIELTAIDPQLGCVFYTFESSQKSSDDMSSTSSPNIIRDRGQCLSCHATTRTERVPGVLVRSIYPDQAGRPRSGASAFVTDYRSPFIKRWGGWYVTGEHGSMRHLGNQIASDRIDPQKIDSESGANWNELPKSIDLKKYPRSTSDIVSLMVLEHQTRLHNLITRANYEARQATYLDQSINKALDRPNDYVSESTQRRIKTVSDDLLKGILLADEFVLEQPIQGSNEFNEVFAKRGKVDSQGRSLHQLDLQKRLFKYPVSYLVLSPHFDALPKPVLDCIRRQLRGILVGSQEAPPGVSFNQKEREVLFEILDDLKPGWLDDN
jgi:hypothetical protein